MQEDDRERCAVYRFMHEVYGLTLVPPETERVAITPAIQQMIDDRQAARERRDFKTADELRDKLVSLGVNLQDTGVKK